MWNTACKEGENGEVSVSSLDSVHILRRRILWASESSSAPSSTCCPGSDGQVQGQLDGSSYQSGLLLAQRLCLFSSVILP